VVAPPTPPSGTAIRIGAWNLHAHGAPDQTIARIAAAIDAHFDIVSVTVVPTADGQADADALLGALAPRWSALRPTTPPPGTVAGAFYAVLYRRERTQPCRGWDALRYVPERGGAAAASNAAMQCFEAEIVDLGGFDVLPVVVRIRGARGSE
jgi:hypothetical protein